MILTPISVGELIDKITILEIKFYNIKDKKKIKNIKKELNILQNLCEIYEISSNKKYKQFKDNLKKINFKLWEIEDKIRIKESFKKFDEEFIELARAVYITNDDRAKIKKKINLFFDSDVVEEKSYNNGKQ